MIQLILRFSKFCFILLLTLLFASCKHEISINGFGKKIHGSGNVITEKREVSQNFDKIHVSSIFDVVLVQGSNPEITIEADDNIVPYILTEINQNTLKIHFDNVSINNPKKLKVYVRTPDISELRASASSKIKTKGVVKTNDLILKTSSTADIELGEVNAKSVIAEASSSSEIKIDRLYAVEFKAQASSTADIEAYVEVDKLMIDASSSSDIELKGKAMDLVIDASSTATVDAKELLVNNVVASSSSSSTIKIHPIVSLKAKASSASDIYYYNEPTNIEKSTSSSGSIKKK